MRLRILTFLVLVLALMAGLFGPGVSPVRAATVYYVATNGNDANNGTSLATPFRTIQRCANAAQAGDTCQIRAGTYRETVTVPRSGAAGSPITFMPYNNEVVTISGVDAVTGWTPFDVSGGRAIYRAPIGWNLRQRSPSANADNQVFIDGRMMVEARWPNISFDQVTRQRDQVHHARSDGATNISAHNATYLDSGMAQFGPNFWQGAKITFGPGWKISWTTCDVTGSTSASVSFQCNPDPGAWNNRTNLLNGSFYSASVNNPFYLWGKLSALDAPGEWFHDGSFVYLWTPDSANPAQRNVEVRRRLYAFDLSSRSHITIQGLRLFAATVRTNVSTTNMIIDGIEGYYLWHVQELPPLFFTVGTRAITLFGSNNVVRNSLIAYTASTAIALSSPGEAGGFIPSNNLVHNNVIFDAAYNVNQFVLGGDSPGGPNTNVVRQNTVYNSGGVMISASPGLDILYNDVYQSHLQLSDLGIIYTWNTDGKDAEIAYNFVHDGYGELNSAFNYWGTHGIYLDDNARNYVIHHNMVWATNQPGIFTYGVTEAGYRHIYNNTVDARIAFDAKSDQTLVGTVVRNNIATTADLSAANLIASNNFIGDGIYLDRAGRDLRLRSDSPAINGGAVLPPWTDGFVGPAPDIGAHEFGTIGFMAGALIRQQDIAGLTLNCAQDVAGTTASCTVTNLPMGRKLPIDMEIRIGTASSANNCWTTMNYTTHFGTARCNGIPTGGLSGVQPISVRLPGGAWTTTSATINLGPLAVFNVSPTTGPTTGGTTITLTGRRFQAASSLYALTVNLSNSGSAPLSSYQVPVVLNTAALISAGKMRPDCGDIRFNDSFGASLPYWIEEGCNSGVTRVWVRVPTIPVGASSIRMTYGNPNLTSASNGPATFIFFDDFNDGSLNPLITTQTHSGVSVSETGGQIRITGTTTTANQYSDFGFFFQTWNMNLPQQFAFDSELTVVAGPGGFKATTGGDMALYSSLPKRIGFYSGGWQQTGTSTINTATFTSRKFSVGYSGPNGNRTVRWYENGNLSTPLAARVMTGGVSAGFFRYGPDSANQTFDVRYDNIRIRAHAFPEPSTSVGAEAFASSRVTVGGLPCTDLVVVNSTTATCSTPRRPVGPAPVVLTNPDNTSATFNSFTYMQNSRPDTVGIFRPSLGQFFLRNSNTTGPADITFTFGAFADLPVAGDWNGDGIDTIGYFRPSTGQFFLKDSNTTAAPIVYTFSFGGPGDWPLAGDWDGDGRDGVGTYRPSTARFFLKNVLTTGLADFQMVLGGGNDRPVGGDWDGDGVDSPGVYRPGNSNFYLTNQVCTCTPSINHSLTLGNPGDVGFAGDWDADGRSGVGVFRATNGITYLRNTLTTGFADVFMIYGIANDRPVAGRWTLTTSAPSSPTDTAPEFKTGN